MHLLRHFLQVNEHEFHENSVRLRVIGRIGDLPAATRRELTRVIDATAHYTEGQLILALSYGGRTELTDAMRGIARDVKSGKLSPQRITEQTIASHLYAPDIPDPDLMIRTSGEMRISNFLLWQLSYSELYVTRTLWPDFREAAFRKALAAYARRKRRFGAVKESI